MLSRRSALRAFCCVACAGAIQATPALAADPVPQTRLTPDQALARLMSGNRRFVRNQPQRPPIGSSRRHQLAGGQAPFASVVGCADSRVPPETLFGVGLGEIFTARVAGNTVPSAALSSLVYSTEALGVPLILVIGHERCGAVGAAVELVTRNAQPAPAMLAMVEPIVPAVRAAQGMPGDLLDNAVRQNAILVAQAMRADPAFAPRIQDGRLKIAAARYDLDDGAVQILAS